ncbi:GNAT family N-acetyltransferase [Novosphingobium sp. FSY-8]|uniref:GNAT family N-acetyltransferase n=1 Tax=Novosphingobium ovatum TaxID=1908523 RepID=A0ABW9XD33_9SPHN|nr:GNAT family N-acetyltransferase [Novosphingobium ovatum]NBC36443.1 GNAT family N-acetyltransferase [Novosphingobium ovatum]
MTSPLAIDVTVRAMGPGDIEAATELSRALNWPHREEDWAFFLELGEGLVAEHAGRVVGTIMAWRYGVDAATLGMVIVADDLQGRGLGRRLMQAMIDRLDGRTIVLHATPAGQPLYEKLGFVAIGRVHQHQGVAPMAPLAELLPDERVRPMGAQDDAPPALYSRASGMDRADLVEAMAQVDKGVVLTRDHLPVGFAMLRRFGRGWSIAPVVAPDSGGAKVLVLHWLGQNKGSFTRIDVTEAGGLSPWLEGLGLPRVDTVVQMARGAVTPPADGISVYALSAQALG